MRLWGCWAVDIWELVAVELWDCKAMGLWDYRALGLSGCGAVAVFNMRYADIKLECGWA